MKKSEKEINETDQKAPKLSRRLSLGGLLRSRSHRLTEKEQERQGDCDVNSVRSGETSGSERLLRRRRTISDVMGKIFRKKDSTSRLFLDDNVQDRSTTRVSSIYQQENVSLDSSADQNRNNSRSVFLPAEEKTTATASQTRKMAASCISKLDNSKITSLHVEAGKRDTVDRPMRILGSTRCALNLSITAAQPILHQGNLSITTQDLHFQANSMPALLNFRLPYQDIVAMIPFGWYGSNGIQVATPTRLIKFVNIPHRDDYLRMMLNEWSIVCRMMLSPCGKISSNNSANSIWQRSLERRSSMFRCGCESHYRTEIATSTFPTSPFKISAFIFGGKLHGGPAEGFLSSWLRTEQGIQMSCEEWSEVQQKDNDNKVVMRKRRVCSVGFPNDEDGSPVLLLQNEQTVLCDDLDRVVIESVMRPAKMDKQSNIAIVRLRWCVTRENNCWIRPETQIVINGEVDMEGKWLGDGEETVQMAKTLRESVSLQFKEMLKAINDGNYFIPPLILSDKKEEEEDGRLDQIEWISLLKQVKMLILIPMFSDLKQNYPRTIGWAILAALMSWWLFSCILRLKAYLNDELDPSELKAIIQLTTEYIEAHK